MNWLRLQVREHVNSQKLQYRQTKSQPGDRVVYIPAAKACKAYKFARPFCGPYQIIEQNNFRVLV